MLPVTSANIGINIVFFLSLQCSPGSRAGARSAAEILCSHQWGFAALFLVFFIMCRSAA
jgi:hypothetical protein